MMIFDSFGVPGMVWHPDCQNWWHDWQKWRLTFEGGEIFKDQYLQKYSTKETDADFALRKANTFVPAYAKAAVQRIINCLSDRFGNISRKSTSRSYIDACAGHGGGVDNDDSTMNYFMGTQVLPELVVMGKVAVYVDMPKIDALDLFSQYGLRPYLYTYTREQIVNWTTGHNGELKSIMLQEYVYEYDERFNMPNKLVTQYRHYFIDDLTRQVSCCFMNDKCEPKETVVLNLTKIPIALFELNASLMTDIADYQIALMNMSSSDVSSTIKSVFPFYVEMYDMVAEATLDNIQQGYEEFDDAGNSIGGTEAVAQQAKAKEITVGTTKGRRFPKGLEFPKFIAPPTEPVKISIEKQEQMKREINELLDLSLSSTQSKSIAKEMLVKEPSGVNQIGLEMQAGERKILEIWQDYESNKKPFSINYPDDYFLKPFSDRINEADALLETVPKIPSNTLKRELAKKAALTLLGGTVDLDVIAKINAEIDKASAVVVDYKSIQAHVELGLVTTDLASTLSGYPAGEAEKAKDEHAERLMRIAAIQGGPENSPAARGVSDMSATPKTDAKLEKKVSQEPISTGEPTKKVRGDGK